MGVGQGVYSVRQRPSVTDRRMFRLDGWMDQGRPAGNDFGWVGRSDGQKVSVRVWVGGGCGWPRVLGWVLYSMRGEIRPYLVREMFNPTSVGESATRPAVASSPVGVGSNGVGKPSGGTGAEVTSLN